LISKELPTFFLLAAELRKECHGNKSGTNMKTSIKPILLSTGLIVGLGLTSCVETYDAYGPHHSTTTIMTYEPGYHVTTLPSGYRTERISGTTYYYHDGAYFRSRPGGFVVVEAPRTSRYYTEYDAYRRRTVTQRTTRDHRDIRGPVVDERRIVTRLPSGYRTVTHRGIQYYQSGDRYYQRQGSGYVVVARPY
jgi:hypothetical protein